MFISNLSSPPHHAYIIKCYLAVYARNRMEPSFDFLSINALKRRASIFF